MSCDILFISAGKAVATETSIDSKKRVGKKAARDDDTTEVQQPYKVASSQMLETSNNEKNPISTPAAVTVEQIIIANKRVDTRELDDKVGQVQTF